MENSLLARLLVATRAVAPLAPINPTALSLPQLALGQTVRALVTARLTDGSFRVVIGDAPLRVALPSATKPGDVVTMRLLAREPHLEFELRRPAQSAEPRLSGAARLIGQIRNEPVQSRPQQSQPVAEMPIADATKLHEPLARAIQRSGLFYEAHQARWIDGDYPLALLQEEPQALLAQRSPARGFRPSAETLGLAAQAPELEQLASRSPSGDPEPPEVELDLNPNGQPVVRNRDSLPQPAAAMRAPENAAADETATMTSARGSQAGPPAPASGDDRTQPKVPRELLPIVRQQLEAIETRQIVWQGELWPGQSIRWQIADQEPESQHPQTGREWLTTFALRLPALGDIDADLAVGAHGVRILVNAADRATAEALLAARPELARSLDAAGLRVAAIEVRHRE